MENQKSLTHNVNTEVTITTPSGLVMLSQMGSNVILHPDQINEVISFLSSIETESLVTNEAVEISEETHAFLDESQIQTEESEESESI